MLELLLGGQSRNPGNDTGSGPTTLLYGDSEKGYYGSLTQTEFITGPALASLIGLTTGTDYNAGTPWLKFASSGKTLFIPQKSLRHSIGWDAIYNCGAVYGDDTNGYTNPGAPVLQDRRVTIAGKTYRVRLITGSSVLPAGSNTPGGEWDKLFYPLINGEWQTVNGTVFLGASGNTDSGSCTLCQETQAPKATPTSTSVVRRGFTDYTTYGTSAMSITSNRGWRPVLELVP